MNEVKKPKKPLIFYYGIVLLVVILFNSIFMPMFLERQVKEVDYGTFMTMIDEGDIGLVKISESENQITFTDKEQKKVYKTGITKSVTHWWRQSSRTPRPYRKSRLFLVLPVRSATPCRWTKAITT